MLTRYIRHTHPPVQRDLFIGSVKRRGGAWGAIALRRTGPSVRSRGSAPDRARCGGTCRPPFTGSTATACWAYATASTARSWSRSIQGSLLPDSGRHPIADPLRSFVGAAHSRGGRRVAAGGRRTDRVDQGQERRGSGCGFQSATTPRRCCSRNRSTASIGTATPGGSGSDQPAGGLAALLDYNSQMPPTASMFAKRRCCVRRW